MSLPGFDQCYYVVMIKRLMNGDMEIRKHLPGRLLEDLGLNIRAVPVDYSTGNIH